MLILNTASRLHVAAFRPNKTIDEALADGFQAVSMLPGWTDPHPSYLRHVAYVEHPWNPGNPWQVVNGYLTKNPYAPKLQDLLMPWDYDMWMRKVRMYLNGGARLIAHTMANEAAVVELSPKIRRPALEVLEHLQILERMVCFDTLHAVRKAGESERQPGESMDSDLGPYEPWLKLAIAQNMLAVFDFHLTPIQTANMDIAQAMDMLEIALGHGYKGDIRVEAALPVGPKLLLESRKVTQELLRVIRRVTSKYA